jgi:hypothetical protein
MSEEELRSEDGDDGDGEEEEEAEEDDSLDDDDDRLELDHRDDDEYSASSQLPSRFTGSIRTVVLS